MQNEKRTFMDLGLLPELQKALVTEGYVTPTPIQTQAIPYLLEGRDLLGCAQTGTGKTAAFALPILQHLAKNRHQSRNIRTLILTPTRELAAQIEESFITYGHHLNIRSTVVFGGVNQVHQVKALKKGPQILVATPGRLLDLMGQGYISLEHLEVFVLDEADRMLDMGFIHDVRRVMEHLPSRRQTLLFSATMPTQVAKLASSLLTDAVRIDVAPQSTPAERIEQSVMFMEKAHKRKALTQMLREESFSRVLIFTRTKHMANRLAGQLSEKGIVAAAIHGNKSQSARTKALEGFRDGSVRVLVATDIAARGIDVELVSHVINFELPNEPESYVHRIGRTARAGQEGIAISLCAGGERAYLSSIEKLLGTKIPVVQDHEFHSEDAEKGWEDGKPCDNSPKHNRTRRAKEHQRPHRSRRR